MKYRIEIEYERILKEIEVLEKEKKNLPKGNIRKKQIRAGIYYYLQYREGNHVKSQYVKREEVPELQKKIAYRKKIEDQICVLKEQKRNYEKSLGLHVTYRPVENVDYQEYTLFISAVAHDYKRLGLNGFIQKYDVSKYRGVNKRYLKGYLDYINGIERGKPRMTNDLVLDPYTYLMYFKYGNKDVLQLIHSQSAGLYSTGRRG